MRLVNKETGQESTVSLEGAAVLIGRGTHEPADKPKAKAKPAAKKAAAPAQTEEE